jgi:hypothetical protein
MTRNDRDKSSAELEALYREHGDAEPPEGLDRIVRARAERAAESGRRRLAPWIGGVATASVAVVAVAIVLNQSPQPTALQPPETAPQSEAAPAADVQRRSARPAVEAASDRSAGFIAAPDEQGGPAAAAELPGPRDDVDADESLSAIRAQIDAGDCDAARRLLAAQRERDPDFQLPADLADALDAEASGPDARCKEDDPDDSGR